MGAQGVIADAQLLAECDYLVGTHTSAVAASPGGAVISTEHGSNDRKIAVMAANGSQ